MWFSTPCNLQDLFTAVRTYSSCSRTREIPLTYMLLLMKSMAGNFSGTFCIWDPFQECLKNNNRKAGCQSICNDRLPYCGYIGR
jgi:hypothetical protein